MSLTFKIDLTTNLPKLHLAGGLPLLLLTTEITSTMPAILGSPTTPGLRLSSLSQWSCQDWHWSSTADVTNTGTMSRSEPRMSQQAFSQPTGQMTQKHMGTSQSLCTRLFKSNINMMDESKILYEWSDHVSFAPFYQTRSRYDIFCHSSIFVFSVRLIHQPPDGTLWAFRPLWFLNFSSFKWWTTKWLI